MLGGLSQEEFDRLHLSVGTHRSNRPLSPIEVGRYCLDIRNSGVKVNAIASCLSLEGSSMIARFIKILGLEEEIQHLVDWGESMESVIGFSTAFEIVSAASEFHRDLAYAVCERGLTKSEVKSVRQLTERSSKPLVQCIEEVFNRRAVNVIRQVIVGAIDNKVTAQKLEALLQSERDELLAKVLEALYPNIRDFTGKLGRSHFTVIGSSSVGATIGADPEFEGRVSNLITDMVVTK